MREVLVQTEKIPGCDGLEQQHSRPTNTSKNLRVKRCIHEISIIFERKRILYEITYLKR